MSAPNLSRPAEKARRVGERGPGKKASDARTKRVDVRLSDVEEAILLVAAKGGKGGLVGFIRLAALNAAAPIYNRRTKR